MRGSGGVDGQIDEWIGHRTDTRIIDITRHDEYMPHIYIYIHVCLCAYATTDDTPVVMHVMWFSIPTDHRRPLHPPSVWFDDPSMSHPRCEEQLRPATIPTPTQHCGGYPMSCWILGPSPYMDPGLPWGGMGDEFPILYIIDPPGHSHDGQRQQHRPIPAPGPSIRVMPALYHMGG